MRVVFANNVHRVQYTYVQTLTDYPDVEAEKTKSSNSSRRMTIMRWLNDAKQNYTELSYGV